MTSCSSSPEEKTAGLVPAEAAPVDENTETQAQESPAEEETAVPSDAAVPADEVPEQESPSAVLEPVEPVPPVPDTASDSGSPVVSDESVEPVEPASPVPDTASDSGSPVVSDEPEVFVIPVQEAEVSPSPEYVMQGSEDGTADITPEDVAGESAVPSVPDEPEPAEVSGTESSVPPVQDSSADIPVSGEPAEPAENSPVPDVPESIPETESGAETEPAPESSVEEMPGQEIEESLPVEPSRSVSLSRGQLLEIWYPGRGWVFLGLREKKQGVSFDSRRLDDRDTMFLFRTFEEGSYILDFSRFDVLTGGYVEDAVSVTVLPDSGESGGEDVNIVRAPDYQGLPIQAVLPEKDDAEEPAVSGEQSDAVTEEEAPAAAVSPGQETEAGGTAVDDIPAAEPSASPESASPEGSGTHGESSGYSSVFQEPSVITLAPPETETSGEDPGASPETSAGDGGTDDSADVSSVEDAGTVPSGLPEIKSLLEAGDSAGALDALDRFFASSSSGTDEALFLQGQAYEMPGPRRNIRRALSSYETLTEMYPYSEWWDAADRRIRYIRRFYFDIR